MPRRLSFTRLSTQEQPLVYLALAFVAGQLLAARLSLSGGSCLIVACVAWLLAVVHACARGFVWRRSDAGTALLLAGFCAIGAALWALNEAGVGEDRVRRMMERGAINVAEPVEVWGVLSAEPELAPERVYLNVEAWRIAASSGERAASGTLRLSVSFFEGDESRAEYDALGLGYGSRVRLFAYLRNAHGYRNPGAVNFDEVLEHRGYDAAGVVKSPLLIEKLGDARRSGVLRFLYRVRARGITRVLHDFKQPTAGVVAAVLFGNQYFLERETAENFRASGTFHLLVISGLHVTLIALVALALARPLTLWLVDSRLLRYALVAALMWGYALMVGAQPAVTRATVMLTVVLASRLVFRRAAGANTLAAAALALLVWQPRDLTNPAFQLSFLTVLMTVVMTAPLLTRLQSVGAWRPTALTPYPPRLPAWVKWCAEVFYWNEAGFRADMRREAVKYNLEKARAARLLSGFSVTRLLTGTRAARKLSRAPVVRRLSKKPAVRKFNEWLAARRLDEVSTGRAVQWCLAWAVSAVVATVGVQIGLLPLMVAHFHRFSLISPLANVVEGALMFALMIAGGAYLLLSSFAPAFAVKLSGPVNALGEWTTSAAEPLRRMPKAHWRVPDYGEASVVVYAAYFALLLALLLALDAWNPLRPPRVVTTPSPPSAAPPAQRRSEARLRRAGVGALLAALLGLTALIAWHPFPHRFERGRLSVTFLDAGQGDAILVSFPQGALMLLDAGGRIPFGPRRVTGEGGQEFVEDRPGVGEVAVAPYLWRRGVKRLDFIAASHAHSDHTEGFADIARSFEIGAALTGVVPSNDEDFELFSRAAAAARMPLRSLARGQSFESEGVRVETLAPFADQLDAARSGNDESLVLRLTFGERTFLLTGDIERRAEARLVAAGDELRADVLKVAHHGSRTSSTPEFLERVRPSYAVISVAAPSPFEHPHPQVLENLRRAGAEVLQTSACGAVTISTDGRDLRVETFVKCR
jgi:competence protein ComEC